VFHLTLLIFRLTGRRFLCFAFLWITLIRLWNANLAPNQVHFYVKLLDLWPNFVILHNVNFLYFDEILPCRPNFIFLFCEKLLTVHLEFSLKFSRNTRKKIACGIFETSLALSKNTLLYDVKYMDICIWVSHWNLLFFCIKVVHAPVLLLRQPEIV
jgi:hypothetical protein